MIENRIIRLKDERNIDDDHHNFEGKQKHAGEFTIALDMLCETRDFVIFGFVDIYEY